MIKRNTPELFVRDVDESVRYYVDVLGFKLAARVPADAGEAAEWARVEHGDVSFMFEATPEPRVEGVAFYLDVEDVDRLAAELSGRGASVDGPTDQWYGSRELTVNDPTGFRLVFASPVPAEQASSGQ